MQKTAEKAKILQLQITFSFVTNNSRLSMKIGKWRKRPKINKNCRKEK